jgi:hypothetical protein
MLVHFTRIKETRIVEILKSTIFWDVEPGSQVEVYQLFGGNYWLLFQGRKVSHENTKYRAVMAKNILNCCKNLRIV